MKIEIAACVNVVKVYDLIRVEIEVPDDASVEDIRREVLREAQHLLDAPEWVPGSTEAFRDAHIEGSVSDIRGGDLSDKDLEEALAFCFFSEGV